MAWSCTPAGLARQPPQFLSTFIYGFLVPWRNGRASLVDRWIMLIDIFIFKTVWTICRVDPKGMVHLLLRLCLWSALIVSWYIHLSQITLFDSIFSNQTFATIIGCIACLLVHTFVSTCYSLLSFPVLACALWYSHVAPSASPGAISVPVHWHLYWPCNVKSTVSLFWLSWAPSEWWHLTLLDTWNTHWPGYLHQQQNDERRGHITPECVGRAYLHQQQNDERREHITPVCILVGCFLIILPMWILLLSLTGLQLVHPYHHQYLQVSTNKLN